MVVLAFVVARLCAGRDAGILHISLSELTIQVTPAQ